MQTRLTEMNYLLFEQIKKVASGDISKEELELEVKKSKAITEVANSMIKNGQLQFQTLKMASDMGIIGVSQVEYLLAPPRKQKNE